MQQIFDEIWTILNTTSWDLTLNIFLSPIYFFLYSSWKLYCVDIKTLLSVPFSPIFSCRILNLSKRVTSFDISVIPTAVTLWPTLSSMGAQGQWPRSFRWKQFEMDLLEVINIWIFELCFRIEGLEGAAALRTGVRRCLISTQVDNVAVQRVWARLGFEPSGALHTFHLWLR